MQHDDGETTMTKTTCGNTGFHQQLLESTEIARQSIYQIDFLQRGIQGQLSLHEYVGFLTQAYHHVKHTVPLLMACGSRLRDDQEWLRVAIAEYIEEETGHQEWILNDIAACGADAEKARTSQPNQSTELMVAYAYDAVARRNPLGFFGMVQVLEGTSIAVADEAASAIRQSLGLPRKAFTYLSSHGSLDVEHVEFFKGLMNRIDNPEDQKAITHCANVFYKLYGDIFRELGNAACAKIAA